MLTLKRLTAPITLLALATIGAAVAPAQGPTVSTPPIVGRWDLTVQGARGNSPSWLEVWTSGNTHLVGQFVGSGGSARPISLVEFTNNTVKFSIPPQWDRRSDNETYEATVSGDTLDGWTTDRTGRKVTFSGRRAPSLARTGTPTWGDPIALTSRSSWREAKGWTFRDDGVIAGSGKADNLVTTQTFNDFALHVEFRLPKGSNSGVYLRGRYEVQIEDSDAAEPPLNHIGGIYGFLAPTWDVRRQPGEWQTFDITLVGRIVSIEFNGTKVICDREIPGITGGAIDSDEGAPGPILLQGDHGAIEYRNMTIRPAR